MSGYDEYIGSKKSAYIQFENVNEGRNYPFADDAVLIDETGVELPNGLVSDMRLALPDGCTAFLSSVHISKYMVTLCVKVVYKDDGSLRSALSVRVKASDLEPYVPYRFEPLTGSEDTGGIVSFGSFEPEATISFRFKDGVAPLSDCAMARFVPAGVRKFIDPRSGKTLSGDVRIEFSNYVEARSDGNGVFLGLKEGAADILMPDCDKNRPVNSCGATPVTSINGIAPDDKKRIVLWFN